MSRPCWTALGDERPRALLLTHIHLDHAAATGALVRRWPDLEVYVHERGAPAPDRPLEAAGQRRAPLRRRDGAALGRDRAGAGGQREAARGRRDGARHARRLHPRPRLPPRLLPARGERHRLRRRRRRRPHPGLDLVVPPTPPPDIDVEAWEDSIGIVEGLASRSASPSPTSARSTTPPRTWRSSASACARRPSWPASCPRTTTSARHRDRVAERAEATEAADELIQCVPPQYQWRGLDRYWRKREEREAA